MRSRAFDNVMAGTDDSIFAFSVELAKAHIEVVPAAEIREGNIAI
jgi:hypothetical protein